MTWLPDAMAGPTPVSALIHAATMVTAGVYLLCRLFPLVSLSPVGMAAIASVGAFTALYAATCALGQTEIKRVLAYSTMSQVGYMFLAVGAGTVAGAMFHLFIHAFFKALLFMGAGCVIHLLDDERNIFHMGGLARRAPAVFWPFLAGALCLAGAPLTGGFFSKEGILMATFANANPLLRLSLGRRTVHRPADGPLHLSPGLPGLRRGTPAGASAGASALPDDLDHVPTGGRCPGRRAPQPAPRLGRGRGPATPARVAGRGGGRAHPHPRMGAYGTGHFVFPDRLALRPLAVSARPERAADARQDLLPARLAGRYGHRSGDGSSRFVPWPPSSGRAPTRE